MNATSSPATGWTTACARCAPISTIAADPLPRRRPRRRRGSRLRAPATSPNRRPSRCSRRTASPSDATGSSALAPKPATPPTRSPATRRPQSGISNRVVHKSDHGLVQLNLTGRAAAEQAFDAVIGRLAAARPGGATPASSPPMEHGALELIVGAKYDPQFGATILVGAGGVLVDLLDDVQVALAPLTHRGRARHACAACASGRCWTASAAARSSTSPPWPTRWSASANSPPRLGEQLRELDINPLLVREQGRGRRRGRRARASSPNTRSQAGERHAPRNPVRGI